ncbi:hypothetical protein ABIB45_000290 [Arthrobacter sp. UYCo732]
MQAFKVVVPSAIATALIRPGRSGLPGTPSMPVRIWAEPAASSSVPNTTPWSGSRLLSLLPSVAKQAVRRPVAACSYAAPSLSFPAPA